MLGRLLGGILADPVIVMTRPESFRNVVAEVRRDAVDFPLEIDGVKEPMILPSASMVAAAWEEKERVPHGTLTHSHVEAFHHAQRLLG